MTGAPVDPGGSGTRPGPVRDRYVLVVAAAVVALVLGLLLLSAVVRPLGDALALAPVLIGVLVVVTVVVLVRAIRGPRV